MELAHNASGGGGVGRSTRTIWNVSTLDSTVVLDSLTCNASSGGGGDGGDCGVIGHASGPSVQLVLYEVDMAAKATLIRYRLHGPSPDRENASCTKPRGGERVAQQQIVAAGR